MRVSRDKTDSLMHLYAAENLTYIKKEAGNHPPFRASRRESIAGVCVAGHKRAAALRSRPIGVSDIGVQSIRIPISAPSGTGERKRLMGASMREKYPLQPSAPSGHEPSHNGRVNMVWIRLDSQFFRARKYSAHGNTPPISSLHEEQKS